MAPKKKEEGQALVEFALILPLLLILFFAIIEFGYLFYHHYCLADGVRAGVRAGALGLDSGRIQEAVISTSSLPIAHSDITIERPQTMVKGAPFRVSAVFHHRLLTPILGKKSIALSFSTRSAVEN